MHAERCSFAEKFRLVYVLKPMTGSFKSMIRKRIGGFSRLTITIVEPLVYG